MGLNQNFKYLICTVLFLFFLLLGTSGFPSHSSSHDIFQPAKVPHEVPAHDQNQEFYVKNIKNIKNTNTFAMNGEQDLRKKRIRSKSKKDVWRKKNKKEKSSRPSFEVMLPKGFVPPSGSSPACSNKYPASARASFYCHLSTANP